MKRLAIALLLVVAIAEISPPAAAQAGTAPAGAAFLSEVDLAAFGCIAVHHDGRVKSFESFARETMALITGPHEYDGRPAVVMYLDLMLRPEAYRDADVVYVKSKLIRSQIAGALRNHAVNAMRGDPAEASVMAELDDRLRVFIKKGLISEPMLLDQQVRSLLARLETDLISTARFVRAIATALDAKEPAVLADRLRIVAPPGNDASMPWIAPDELVGIPPVALAGVESGATLVEIADAWRRLRSAWQRGDAPGVNAAAAALTGILSKVNPALYPDHTRLEWESRYFRWKNMTWVWIVYALGLIPLLLYVVFRWPGARIAGMLLFCLAFVLHTAAVGLRWYVADRWPNTNMFEAVTTSAWFGSCFALVLEVLVRRTPIRGLLALGAAATSMVALMAAHYLPLQLNPGIGNRMPVLHDVWLYIHTNVIIFSYCLIFIASISAGLYLAYRALRRLRGSGPGKDEYARVGGAGSLIMTSPEGGSCLARRKTTIGPVLDGTTMIVLELAFIMLWTGLVMGAIWADHSWGRPWGWDPKEVFALNTFIIFALLIHTRLKVRDKGLWTAILAVIGCAVMLFNWIVINFTIAGLHSYA